VISRFRGLFCNLALETVSMKKLLVVCILFVGCFQAAHGQEPVKVTRDSIYIEAQDTMLIQSYAKRYDPRKALLLAAVLPGVGQVYNKKYWKLPLVFGGFYLIGNGISHYNTIFKTYKGYLFYNLEHNLTADSDRNTGPNLTTGQQLSTGQLRRIVDKARRERDFMVILMGGMYILQIIDAHVDAHLKEFDLNPNLKKRNLKARIEPTVTQDAVLGRQTGVSLIFRF
jgi:hypothetical protein